MKKNFLVMFIAFASISAYAQKGEKAAGINFSYGTEHKAIGIGVKGQYGITNAIRTEVAFDYFLEKDNLSMWDINLNVHYLFSITEQFKAYPLAGVAFTNWTTSIGSFSSSTSRFGANIGAGVQYNLTERLAINLEGKYQIISDFDQPIFNIGLAYKF